MLIDILCRCSTLVRVCETYLEYVGLTFDHICGRCGRSDLEHIVRCCHICDCDTRRCCYRTVKDLHTPVFQGVVGVDRFLRVILVILKTILNLRTVDTACLINLINSDLRAVLCRITINRRCSCCRSDSADVKCVGILFLRSAGTATACQTSHCHRENKGRCH